MSREPVISVEGVSKGFRMRSRRATTLKSAIFGLLRRELAEPYQALQDVSFDVYEGETVGIVGSNGSGKSTVLKLITGIIKPTTGHVAVRGRISPLIELGAGFHPDFTGRENVFLNGAILGVPRTVIAAAYDDIVAFSGVGEFIDQPVKSFSSGMFTRLAFSIAVHVNPDILVVDEVLAVGDEAFKEKCLGRVRQLRDAGKTILFVAHDQRTVASVCDRVIWLEKGIKRMDGRAEEVLAAYQAHSSQTLAAAAVVALESLAVVGEGGRPIEAIAEGDVIAARFSWRAVADATITWSISLRRLPGGAAIAGADAPACPLSAGEIGEVTFTSTLGPLAAGEYELSVQAMRAGEAQPQASRTLRLHVDSGWMGPAPWRLDGEWALRGRRVLSDL